MGTIIMAAGPPVGRLGCYVAGIGSPGMAQTHWLGHMLATGAANQADRQA